VRVYTIDQALPTVLDRLLHATALPAAARHLSCEYICVHVHAQECVCVCVCVCVCMYVCVGVYAYVCVFFVCTCRCVCVCVCVVFVCKYLFELIEHDV
jgi:hypothetical protein